MDPDFWRDRWQSNQIGFHEGKPNSHLVKHLAQLALPPGARVFVPLCGKSRDIFWLLSAGFQVVGAELSRIAVEQLFAELGIAPVLSPEGPMMRYAAPSIDIFMGDIFDLSRSALGPVDAVYDRAALVALPGPLRARYAAHLVDITAAAPQLLICFEYDQSVMDGPPFSVPLEEVRALYGTAYRLTLLESAPVPGGLKGQYEASEHAFLLGKA